MDQQILPQLTLDGTKTRLEIDQTQLNQFYLPLADFLIQRSQDHLRTMIGIAGPPGSGKSSFAQILTAVINVRLGQGVAAHIGLDGWHYPNSYLDTHETTREGQAIPLRLVKGAPETFDISSALQFLKYADQGEDLNYPIYSREFHEPIPAGAHLSANQRIGLMEGNYLLLDLPGWNAFRPMFAVTIFLNAPREELVKALRLRHLRGGKDSDTVEKHLNFTDLPNLDLIISRSFPADILIEKLDSLSISQVIYPKN